MKIISYHTSDRTKKCRICEGKINKNTWCVAFWQIHVSPHRVNLFFHEGCLSRAMELAQNNREGK